MEITPLNTESKSKREWTRVSSFETEPREFKQWLSGSSADQRLRIDIPIDADPPVLPKAVYGICQPIQTVHCPTESKLPVIADAEKQLRIVRLLEKQQEWYDARELARVSAESYLDLIDQHQKQWLNNQPSTSQENS